MIELIESFSYEPIKVNVTVVDALYNNPFDVF